MPFKNVIDHIERKLAGTHMILLNSSKDIENQAKRGAKWEDRTGHARQSLHSGLEGSGRNFTLYLAHGVKYGRYLEEGTPPHKIRPKNKKALFWSGAAHPVKEVNHPGTKGDALLERTLTQNKDKLLSDIADFWSE